MRINRMIIGSIGIAFGLAFYSAYQDARLYQSKMQKEHIQTPAELFLTHAKIHEPIISCREKTGQFFSNQSYTNSLRDDLHQIMDPYAVIATADTYLYQTDCSGIRESKIENINLARKNLVGLTFADPLNCIPARTVFSDISGVIEDYSRNRNAQEVALIAEGRLARTDLLLAGMTTDANMKKEYFENALKHYTTISNCQWAIKGGYPGIERAMKNTRIRLEDYQKKVVK